MDNIVLKHALKGVINQESGASVGALVEVISATPNPSLAIAMLFGEYNPPIITPIVIDDSTKQISEFVSYNVWSNEVTYKYRENKRKHIYVPKDLDTSVITLDNYKEFEISWSGDKAKSFNLILPELVTKQSTMSLSKWEELRPYEELAYFDGDETDKITY
jgi:hypothetical protein